MGTKEKLSGVSSEKKASSMLAHYLTHGAKSPAHAAFLKKHRLNQWLVRLVQLLLFFLFIAIWELASARHWIDPLLFSRPSRIWSLFAEMLVSGQLTTHITATLLETLVGFFLSTVLGTLIAISIWWSRFLSEVADPYLVVLNGMPKVALGPIFIVAFGGGYGAIIAMGVAVSIIITTIVVYGSFQNVDPNYIKMAKTFGADKQHIFRKIIFPASFPTIISTLKVNVGLAWVGVIVGEFLVSRFGLGYLIIYGFQVFNLTLVFVSLFIIAACATLMYQGVAYLEDKLLHSRGVSS